MSGAALILEFVRWWLMIGAGVAAIFLTIGIDRCDEDAQGAYVFRPLLIPGVMLIWPLVLWRWLRIETGREVWKSRYRPPRASHLPVALILAGALGFAVLAGLSVRQTWPGDIAPEKLVEANQ